MIQPVVIADKNLHKGAMHGHVSNGGGVIDLGNGKALRFTALNEVYVKLQLLECGLGVKVENQSWQKTKKVIEKTTVIKEVEKKPVVKPRKVFEVAEEIGERDLF